MEWVLLGSSLLVILGGAELFTNGVEWVGEGFGGAVGSRTRVREGLRLPVGILPPGAGVDRRLGLALGRRGPPRLARHPPPGVGGHR